jgi:hypothetical protein
LPDNFLGENKIKKGYSKVTVLINMKYRKRSGVSSYSSTKDAKSAKGEELLIS